MHMHILIFMLRSKRVPIDTLNIIKNYILYTPWKGGARWGLKGCWFKPHPRQSHSVVSLRKTHFPLYSTVLVQPRKTLPNMSEKLLTHWDVKNKIKTWQ